MKKLPILLLSAATAFSLMGCSKALVDKNPVVISDTIDLPSADTGIKADTMSASLPSDKETKETGETKTDDNAENKTGSLPETEDSKDTVPLTIEVEGMEETIQGK